MASVAAVKSAMTGYTVPRKGFRPNYNMDTLVILFHVALQNGEVFTHEELTPHAGMAPGFLDQDADVIVKAIFNDLVAEEPIDDTSFSDRLVAANDATPPVRQTKDEIKADQAKADTLKGVTFLPADVR